MKEIAAGGVVFRRSGNGLKLLMIRDRFGQITLPKGKAEPGETAEQTALREIAEETGVSGSIVSKLAQIGYTYVGADGSTVVKEVVYFLVEAHTDTLRAQVEEIADAVWMEPMEAWDFQTESGYDNNDEVLKLALTRLGYEVDHAE